MTGFEAWISCLAVEHPNRWTIITQGGAVDIVCLSLNSTGSDNNNWQMAVSWLVIFVIITTGEWLADVGRWWVLAAVGDGHRMRAVIVAEPETDI